MKTEAERLAGDLDKYCPNNQITYEASAELRRLSSTNAELVKAFEKSQMLFTRKGKYGWWIAEMHKDEWNENNLLIKKAKHDKCA